MKIHKCLAVIMILFQADGFANSFEVTQKTIKFQNTTIDVSHKKRLKHEKPMTPPYVCEAKIEVKYEGKVVYSEFFADIDPSGGDFGIFNIKMKNPNFRAWMKVGDYDNKIFILGSDNRVTTLKGHLYSEIDNFMFGYDELDGSVSVVDLRKKKAQVTTKITGSIVQLINCHNIVHFKSIDGIIASFNKAKYMFEAHKDISHPSCQRILFSSIKGLPSCRS